MPGTNEIEREIRRLDGDDLFAVCYADLDHFKEYNDRYSYYDGDRVIYILCRGSCTTSCKGCSAPTDSSVTSAATTSSS